MNPRSDASGDDPTARPVPRRHGRSGGGGQVDVGGELVRSFGDRVLGRPAGRRRSAPSRPAGQRRRPRGPGADRDEAAGRGLLTVVDSTALDPMRCARMLALAGRRGVPCRASWRLRARVPGPQPGSTEAVPSSRAHEPAPGDDRHVAAIEDEGIRCRPPSVERGRRRGPRRPLRRPHSPPAQ